MTAEGESPFARRAEIDGSLAPVSLPDLSLPDTEKVRLQTTLLGALIRIQLESTAFSLHPASLDFVESRLGARTPMAWTEGSELKVIFAVQGREEEGAARAFAYELAQLYGGKVLQATIYGILASSQDSFMRRE